MSICLHKAGDVLSLSSYLFPSFDPTTNQENPVVYPNHFALRVHTYPLPFIERSALTSGTLDYHTHNPLLGGSFLLQSLCIYDSK